jgi:hypothetical protein
MQRNRPRLRTWTVLHDQFDAKLDTGDIIAFAAYAASRTP